MNAFWHWLFTRTPADVLNAVISVTVARLAILKPLRRHQATQEIIADRLDSTTPGGLGDLVHHPIKEANNGKTSSV